MIFFPIFYKNCGIRFSNKKSELFLYLYTEFLKLNFFPDFFKKKNRTSFLILKIKFHNFKKIF